MASLGLIFNLAPAYALIPNGDFETGNLSGYVSQEDFADVPSSPLVNNVDDGTGNHVGEIKTGFSDTGVTTATLGRIFDTLPADVQDLVFDVKFFDTGFDNPPILTLASAPQFSLLSAVPSDVLTVSFLSDSGNLSPLFALNNSGYSIIDPSLTEVSALSNGYYHVKTNLSGLAGATNSAVYFDLLDEDDNRLSKVNVDNVDLTSGNQAVAPEPASMLLMGAGLAGFGYLRKKKMV